MSPFFGRQRCVVSFITICHQLVRISIDIQGSTFCTYMVGAASNRFYILDLPIPTHDLSSFRIGVISLSVYEVIFWIFIGVEVDVKMDVCHWSWSRPQRFNWAVRSFSSPIFSGVSISIPNLINLSQTFSSLVPSNSNFSSQIQS